MVKLAVELAEAEAHLAKLIRDVGAGAEVLITSNGQPVARLVPVAKPSAGDRVPGSAEGLFKVPDDFDAPLDCL
jgi:prevent-host-death family protein